MSLWGRGQQERQWRAEFKDVSTPELRRMVENGIYAPDKQRFLEVLLRRRERPYTMLIIISMIIGIIIGVINIINIFNKAIQ